MPFLHLGSGQKRIHYTDYRPPAAVVDAAESGRAAGGGGGRTIICHHGLGSSQNFYYPIVPTLTAAGHRVIVFDTCGAARSPCTHEEQQQSIASLAGDVLGVLDALSVRSAVVLGHSMGGIVASHLAAAAKGEQRRIEAAVLIGPVYPTEAVAQVFEKRIQLVGKEGMEPMADSIPFAAPGKSASPLVRAFIRELLLAQTPEGYLSHCQVICNAAKPAYGDVEVPVLILAGDEDRSADLDMCKKMFEEIGTEEKMIKVLEGVGHWHCLEAPDVVAAEISRFLDGIKLP